MVLDATEGLSDAQWNFKPGPDRWSIAEIMEHLAAAEEGLLQRRIPNTMNSPATHRDAIEAKMVDEEILRMAPDRSRKLQAPEPLVPTNRFGTPQESRKIFVESRAMTEELLNTPGLREHMSEAPALGRNLDAYEWILYAAAHSERHTKEMMEVKADPNYPRTRP